MSVGAILTLGLGSFGTVNRLPTLGYGGSTPTPPLPPTPGSSGGDSQVWKPPGWLLDMLEDEERLAKEEKKVKREIKALSKKKAELQASIAVPSQRIDYGRMIAAVQALAVQLQALLDTYRHIRMALEALEADEEEDDMIMLLLTIQGTIQ